MRCAGRLALSFVLLVVAIGAFFFISDGPSVEGLLRPDERRDDVVCDGADTVTPRTESLGEPGIPGVPASVPPVDPAAQLPGEAVRAMTITVELADDGSARFTETIDYDFGGTPDRHGILRQIQRTQPCTERWTRVYPISDVSVASPTGAPTATAVEELSGGVTQLRIGDADRNVTGRHTYVVRYRLAGVVNPFPNHEELYWNVVGDGWVVPIYDTTAALGAPAPPTRIDCFAGPAGSTRRCDAADHGAAGAVFAQQLLAPGSGLTVAGAYPVGTFTETPRYYRENWSLDRAFARTPFTMAGAGLLLVLGVGGALVLGWSVGRDRRVAGAPVDIAFATPGAPEVAVPLGESSSSPVEFAPPDGLRPAQLALLRNEEVRPLDVSATLVDLAVRGVVRIEQVGEGRDTDYRLVLLDRDQPGLLGYERTLVTKLFGTSKESVLLSDLEQKFATKLAAVIEAVYADGDGRGWFRGRPDQVRTRWRGIGIGLFVLTSALLVAAAAFTHLALLFVPPVLVSGGLVLAAGRFPARTPLGTGLTRRVGGFVHFMEDSEAPRARWAEQRDIFSEYLPYAVVLGLTGRWAATFEPLGAEAMAASTAWYVGTEPFRVDTITRATTSFSTAASSSFSSTPPSSSGSSGFSGGSSGGGGGGGGGGSW